MDLATQVQILDKAHWISHSALGKVFIVMLTKERYRENKRVNRKTYIQVTETRYKWT